MSDRCKKCDADFTGVRDVFKCKDCGGSFHQQCIGDLSKAKIGTRNSVRCESCISEMSSTGSRTSEAGTSSRDGAVLEAIAALRADLTERADQHLDRLNSVQAVLNTVVKDVKDLKTQCFELKTISDKTVADVDRLQTENVNLGRAVELLKREVADLQQHSRKNNILISGMPVTGREDLYSILSAIARCLKIDFHPGHVSAAHRLPGSRDNNRPPSIVVCFISRALKMQWCTARRTHSRYWPARSTPLSQMIRCMSTNT